jgi:PAS domain-containing protein
LLIPVYVNGYWWGELVFLYSRNYAASWYHTECDALRTTAALISSILSRVAQLKARANAYLFQQALFDVVPLPLYAKTLDGSFYYANDEFCRLAGIGRR